MSKPFDDRDYTQDALIKQFGLIELHGKDGSAVDADCQCIETKHTYLIEGLAEEGMGFAMSKKEKEFYQKVADTAREWRKRIEFEDWNTHNPSIDCQKEIAHCLKTRSIEECKTRIKCSP